MSSLLMTASAPASAADFMPDPHILAAAPFEFHADSEIFSRVQAGPSDSRIFFPHQKMRRIGGLPSMDDGFKGALGA